MIRALPLLAVLALGACATVPGESGLSASARASGQVQVVVGDDPFDLASTEAGEGTIELDVTNVGDRWSHVQNTDVISLTAEITHGGDEIRVSIEEAMPRHPKGKYTTWFGVAYDAGHHGRTGIGTSELPALRPEISLWGYADVELNGETIGRSVPAHAMVMPEGEITGILLEVETEERRLEGLPGGYLTAQWATIDEMSLPEAQERQQELFGWLLTLAVIAWFGWMAVTEVTPVRR